MSEKERVMDDLISRQAAIGHAISGLTREFEGEKWIRVSEVRESLKTMPSAQPEKCEDCGNFNKTRFLIPQPKRKKGKWLLEKIYEDEHGIEEFNYFCSECGAPAYEFSQPYCHRCGAKMRKTEAKYEQEALSRL